MSETTNERIEYIWLGGEERLFGRTRIGYLDESISSMQYPWCYVCMVFVVSVNENCVPDGSLKIGENFNISLPIYFRSFFFSLDCQTVAHTTFAHELDFDVWHNYPKLHIFMQMHTYMHSLRRSVSIFICCCVWCVICTGGYWMTMVLSNSV